MTDHYQPWKWRTPESSETLKKTITRQDGHDRVSGHAVYTRDISLPGMLYAKILTSPYAHAKIAGMDTSRAEALAGVRDILKYNDPDVITENLTGTDAHYNILTLPGTGDFYQHPMGVVVVADSEEICDQALRLITIQWEERPFVLDMEESLKPTAPKIMAEVERLKATAKEPNTIMVESVDIGDVEKGFAEADKIIEYKITRASNSPAGVEAMACVAQWRGEFLDLWVHHQYNQQIYLSSETVPGVQFDGDNMDNPFSMPHNMGSMPTSRDKPQPPFAPWSKITMTFPYQGSWFGGITWLAYSAAFIRLAVILAKRAAGRPVKLLYDESQFYCNGDESGTYTCKVGAKKDGTITAYHWHTVGMRNPAIDKTPESTSIRNVRGSQEWPFTNQGFHQCFRHGAAACVPHNMMFSRVAAEFGLDPTEVALKNDGCHGHPWEWVSEYQKENGFPQRQSLKEVIEKGKQAIGWDRKWHAPGAKKLSNGKMHGLGFMSIHEWQAGIFTGPAPPFACLILRDGKVTIIGTRCDMGMSTESGFRQCVAAEIGLRYEDTVVQMQRSDNNAFLIPGPAGSFGITGTTPQLVLAARELKQKILTYAVSPRVGRVSSPPFFPGKNPEDLDIVDSHVFEKANPRNRRTVHEIARAFWNTDPAISHPVAGSLTGLQIEGKPDQRLCLMAKQAHFVEVEVDTDTGLVDVLNMVCVNDVGHVFNPKGAEGQQYGGAIMGLGRSATEEKIFCPATGVGLNFDHIGYHLGTMNDYPPVECRLHESHLGYSAYGACGIGENIGASISAITSPAIYNAIGKWIYDFPTTPETVLAALGRI
jgi:xanthine dehydrogenase molybdenum-binding subunit